ncbi:hypothetical protein [Corallococcus sp. EGB]|uniref:hypothetical protein n=1 Tax=Corallococcus sp. EGB TaxID=1521117 RepID=UPI001CBD8927|nr:hypothetical protein [Corallococcus sp. EGB]
MRLKMVVASLGFGSLLMACGGMEGEGVAQDDGASLATTEQGLCDGYAKGARRCSVKCTSTSTWVILNDSVPEGGCQAKADSVCGRPAYGACWSF